MFMKIFGTTLLILSISPIAFGGTIQLSRSGQISCWDASGDLVANCAGTGQDGDQRAGVTWPNPRFVPDGDCVIDNLTGLVWAREGNLAGGTGDWQGALDRVSAINSGSGLCGYHDWRLPNVNELESMVNTEVENTAAWLNDSGFSSVQAEGYWSSSTLASNVGFACVVGMGDGVVGHDYKSNGSYYIWPVRAGQ